MVPDLSVRASEARELMDAPDASAPMLDRTYERFALVNAVVSPWRGLYRRDIRPRARRGPVRLLDIGAGGGDQARALARRLHRDGFSAQVWALDADERAVRWAQAHDATGEVRYRTGSLHGLAEAGESFDVVYSNHVLHHVADAALLPFLEESRRLLAPGGVVVHHDIARGRGAYALFAAATWPFRTTVLAGSYIREDGLTSIRRSYTVAELKARAPADWEVRARMPARVEARAEAPGARA